MLVAALAMHNEILPEGWIYCDSLVGVTALHTKLSIILSLRRHLLPTAVICSGAKICNFSRLSRFNHPFLLMRWIDLLRGTILSFIFDIF